MFERMREKERKKKSQFSRGKPYGFCHHILWFSIWLIHIEHMPYEKRSKINMFFLLFFSSSFFRFCSQIASGNHEMEFRKRTVRGSFRMIWKKSLRKVSLFSYQFPILCSNIRFLWRETDIYIIFFEIQNF